MSFILQWSDPLKTPIVIADGASNSTTSLKLTGRGFLSWGQPLQENIMHLMENFASPTAPSSFTLGQIWFNSDTSRLMLNVGPTTSTWADLAFRRIDSSSPPAITSYSGDLYFDTVTKNLNVYDSSVPSWSPLATTAYVIQSTDTLKTTSINGGQISGFRNKIINGDMSVSQIYVDTSVTPSSTGIYIVDQWAAGNTQPSKLTFQRVTDAPAGFKYSTKITVAAQYSPIATDFFTYQQPIEGQDIVDFSLGTSGAVTLATSNYIKGSVPGIYSVSIRNGNATRSYVGTINVTTVWSKVVITLVGDTTGTWATDNTAGLIWTLDLGSGTNFNTVANTWAAGSYVRTSGSIIFVNQAVNSTLNITGVHLEQVSPNATQGTAFEHVSFADQLRRCQRYYRKSYDYTTLPGSNYLCSYWGMVVDTSTPTRLFINGRLDIRMRADPLVIIYSADGTIGNVSLYNNTAIKISISGSIVPIETGLPSYITLSSAATVNTAYHFHWVLYSQL